MHSQEQFSIGDVTGRTLEICYQVRNGAKPAGQIGVPTELIPVVKEIVQGEGCACIIDDVGYGRASIEIFKSRHIQLVIETLRQIRGSVPEAFSLWCSGKLYGYSEQAITEFLLEQGVSLSQEVDTTRSASFEAASWPRG